VVSHRATGASRRWHAVFIGLGANLGDRAQMVQSALRTLCSAGTCTVRAVSSLYRTTPVGPRQPEFVNAVARIATTLSPNELLKHLKETEQALGRTPGVRWGPRRIDLDILFYDNLIFCSSELTIPHPRIAERRFVLEPLAELSPRKIHPLLHRTSRTLCRQAALTYPEQKVKIIR
jgi:2-amino-4-hydroxy-6-hydroxymethyldihydropteridine diphosphokinase